MSVHIFWENKQTIQTEIHYFYSEGYKALRILGTLGTVNPRYKDSICFQTRCL